MKKSIVLIALALGCFAASCRREPPVQIPLAITIDSMCFDGTSYHVSYTIHRLHPGDVYAKYLFGHDTLSQSKVMRAVGNGSVLLTTGESGCGGRIRFENGDFWASKNGTCQGCFN